MIVHFRILLLFKPDTSYGTSQSKIPKITIAYHNVLRKFELKFKRAITNENTSYFKVKFRPKKLFFVYFFMLVIVNTKTGTAILLNQYSWWLNFFLKAENTSKMAISTQLAESHCVSGVLCAVQLWEAAERHVFQPSLITIKWSQAYTLIITYTGSICARAHWGSLRHSGGNKTIALWAICSIWWQNPRKLHC